MSGQAAEVVAALRARGWTVATAESLTGGLVCSALVDVPGASDVVRGGVVAYAVDVKASLLGVDSSVLRARGAVDPDVAMGMARGARNLLTADIAVATTGVAGPDPADGHAVGTVFVAVATAGADRVQRLELAGDRRAIRESTVGHALAMVLQMTLSDPAG